MALLDTSKIIPSQTKNQTVEEKIITIRGLLGSTLFIRKKKEEREQKEKQEALRIKKEKILEAVKAGSQTVKKVSSILPKTGILDWTKNFLGYTLAGFLITKFNNLFKPFSEFAEKVLPKIGGMFDWMGTFIFTPIFQFVEKSYELYDKAENAIGKYLGEDWKNKFNNFSDLLRKVITAAVITGAIVLRGAWMRRFGKLKNLPKNPLDKKKGGNLKKGNLKKGGIQKPSILTNKQLSRLNKSWANYLSNKSNLGDRLRLLKRGFIKPQDIFKRGLTGTQVDNKTLTNQLKSLGSDMMERVGVKGSGMLKNIKELMKKVKIPIPRWLVGWKGNALINAILAGFAFQSKRKAGDSNLKAGVVTTAEVVGGMGGFWAGAKAGGSLGGTIGAFFGGGGAIPGAFIGALIGGVLGSMLGSSLTGGTADKAIDLLEAQPSESNLSKGLNYQPDYAILIDKYNFIQPVLTTAEGYETLSLDNA